MYDNQNVFAKILRGELPAKKVYENDYALAMHNIAPKSRVHILVIPKGEFRDITDFTTHADAAMQSGFWDAVHQTAAAAGLGNNFCIWVNSGEYQSIMHFHVHLMNDDKYRNNGL